MLEGACVDMSVSQAEALTPDPALGQQPHLGVHLPLYGRAFPEPSVEWPGWEPP